MAAVALGSIYIAYTLPAVYESSAVMLIEQQGVPQDFVQTTVNSYAEELTQSIHQRVVAAPNVVELINRLGLYPDEREKLAEDDLVTLFRESATLEPQNVTTIHARTGRESIVTFGFRLSFSYFDPVRARDVVQELADLYVAQNSVVRSEAAARTTAFLDAEATQIQEALAEVGGRVASFKERHADNLPEHQGVNLAQWERTRTELTSVDAALRDARERKAIHESDLAETPRYRPVLAESGEPVLGGVDRLAEAQQEYIRLRGRYSDNHPTIVNLRREIAALSSTPVNQAALTQQLRADLVQRRAELAAAREVYSENHPDVVALQRAVRSLEEQLNEASNSVAAASPGGRVAPNNPVYVQLSTRIQTADAEIADLTRARRELTARLADLDQRRALAPQVEREYAAIEREQELLMARYRELRGLEGQAHLAQNLEDGDFAERLTIIEPARIPANPVSPDRLSLSFLGIVLAIALGLGVASLVEATDTTVRGQRDIYQFLEMRPMGIIPYVETRQDTMKRLVLNGAMAAGLFVATVYVFMATQA